MQAPYSILGTDSLLVTADEKTIVRIKEEQYTIPSLRMKGSHQRNNVAVACMALHTLCRLGFSLNEEKCIQAIAHAKLPGRFEQIYDKPFMIVDSAHNVQAMHALLTTVRDEIGKRRVHVLFAAYRDKAWQEMVQLIRNECFSLTLTTFSDKRALTIDEICKSDMAKDVLIETDWRTYLTRAILMPNDEVYVITGSFRFIAMVRSWMKKNG